MRMLIDTVGQQAALVEAHIAGGCADQSRDGVALHVLRHVEADHLDAHGGRKLLCHLGLADAGGTREEIAADRLFRFAQARTRELDRGGERVDRLVLPVNDLLERLVEMLQHHRIVLRHGLRRDARHGGDGGFDLLDADGLLAPTLRQQHLRRPRLVDHVDRLVRQPAVMDVTRGELDRRLDRLGGVFELVIVLEIRLEPLEDFDRVRDRRLVDVDLLEAAHQRAILFEVLPVFLVGGRADAAQRAEASAGLSRLEASIAPPEVAPAPITVWISSMNMIAPGYASSSLITCLRRSSKSPRYRVPASSVPMSRQNTVAFLSTSGTSPLTMRRARPSAIAVF